MQDVFICHASSDKDRYIYAISRAFDQAGVSYWLDDEAIAWGDSLALKINEGLRTCKFVLICLSDNFAQSNWSQAEMNAVLSVQNASGQKRVLPLILNSKPLVLETYPLLAGLAFQEFDKATPKDIAELVASLARNQPAYQESIRVYVEGKNSGRVYDFTVPSTCTIKYLLHEVRQSLKLREELDTGSIEGFKIRWVLVGKQSVAFWNEISRKNQQEIYLVNDNGKAAPAVALSELDRIGDFVRMGDTFFLCPIEDTTRQVMDDTVPIGAFH